MILALFNLGTAEIIIIVAVIILLFGGKKIPELMKGIGKGVRNFKQGLNGIGEEDGTKSDASDSSEKS